MEINNTYARDVLIHRVQITSKTGAVVELRHVTAEINIHEDLFNNTVYGNIVVGDSSNLIRNIPIFGFEKILIEFQSPNRKNPYLKEFRVYKVSDAKLSAERSQTYVIHFTSEIHFKDFNTRVSKSYKGKLISSIFEDIHYNYLENPYVQIVEPTKYLHHIVIPNWNPIRAINWLAARANSVAYEGSNYIYFENRNGFNFCSLSKLMDVSGPIMTYVYQVANVRLPYDSDASHMLRDLPQDFRGIQSYEFADPIDILKNLERGEYGSRLLIHSIDRKKAFTTEFDYKKTWEKFKHVEPATKQDIERKKSGFTFISDQEGSLINPNAKIKMYPSRVGQQFENHADQWLLQRASQLEQIHNLKLKMITPGDSNRTVGEIVRIYLPSPEPIYEGEIKPREEKYFSGKYIIASLRHHVKSTDYTNHMELFKDSVFSPFP